MLHAYIASYGICFMATVDIIIMLLIAGVEIDRERAYRGEEVEPLPTARDWVRYILKAFLISFVVSFAAPLVLIFYIFIIGCIIVSVLKEEF